MMNEALCWRQRLANYRRACESLKAAVELARKRPLTELERQGLIQAFEYTHELACKLMKDYLFYQGNSSITGSRDATREAFAAGLIHDGEAWMEMIRSRNLTSHTYNEDLAREIEQKVVDRYYPLLSGFLEKMRSIENESGSE